jgi:hypothetical protein
LRKPRGQLILNLDGNRRQTRGSKMSEMKPENMVRRSVAIALGIICIILVASLIAVYVSMVNTLADKDTTISSLNYQNGALQDQLRDLNFTLHVELETTLYQGNVSQPTGSYTSLNLTVPYAGFLEILIQNPTNNTYVRVIWSYYDCVYDKQFHPDPNIPLVPVLSLSNVEVRVGNNNTDVGATETVAIIYKY